jgi:hypothetical protein
MQRKREYRRSGATRKSWAFPELKDSVGNEEAVGDVRVGVIGAGRHVARPSYQDAVYVHLGDIGELPRVEADLDPLETARHAELLSKPDERASRRVERECREGEIHGLPGGVVEIDPRKLRPEAVRVVMREAPGLLQGKRDA